MYMHMLGANMVKIIMQLLFFFYGVRAYLFSSNLRYKCSSAVCTLLPAANNLTKSGLLSFHLEIKLYSKTFPIKYIKHWKSN